MEDSFKPEASETNIADEKLAKDEWFASMMHEEIWL